MDPQYNDNFAPEEDDLLSMIRNWEAAAQPAVPQPPAPPYIPPEPSYLSPEELEGFQAAFSKAQTPPAPPAQEPAYLSNVLAAADRAWAEPLPPEPLFRAGAYPPPPPSAQAAPGDGYQSSPPVQAPKSGAKQVKQMEKKSKKRKRSARRFFSRALAAVLILTGLLYLAAYAFAGKVGQTDPLPGGGFSRPGVANILVVGMDGEGTKGGGDGRSDTILLLSIDWIHRKLKLTSFLRDSWLPMPGGGYNRINTAFFYGGAAGLAQTITNNFDVRIDHCILLNFTAFQVIVDAVGGIEVPVTDAEARFLCNTTRLGRQIGRESMRRQMNEKGAVKMTGEQALIYSRIRKLDNDFNRTQRQRKVFGILAAKALRSPVSLLFNIGGVLPYVKTDMSRAGLAAFATAAPLFLTFGMEEHQVPADGTWNSANKGGAAVITMDVARNAEELRKFIY